MAKNKKKMYHLSFLDSIITVEAYNEVEALQISRKHGYYVHHSPCEIKDMTGIDNFKVLRKK